MYNRNQIARFVSGFSLGAQIFIAASSSALGQDPSTGRFLDFTGMAKNAPSFSVVIGQFCGSTSNFLANADCEISPPGQAAWIMPTRLAFRDGNFRQEIDIGAMSNIPQSARDTAKAVKFNQAIFLVRLHKKVVDVLFPDFEEYVEIPISDEAIQMIKGTITKAEFQRASIGDAVLDGHSCSKVSVTSKQFPSETATTWNANDMSGFPLRIEMPSLNIHFTNIKLGPPAADLFEVPTNYVRQNDAQAVIKVAIERYQKANNQNTNH